MRYRVLLIIVMFLFIILFCGCRKAENPYEKYIDVLATPINSIVSPSGTYDLKVKEIYVDSILHWFIEIYQVYDNDEKIVYSSKDYFRIKDTIFILWDDFDRIWIYSGDVGTFIWEYNGNIWDKIAFSETNYVAPEALKELRPSRFSN